ncbi:hypothetical protein GCM10010916_21950 [Paenibacillus abyssi]|uniref:Uncharacterized protein n=1 Tax=Paenibacillus abyssi TaxID=1340531 RepID=A0A917D2M8_9BACL|nr:hypothetical protein GCM10010916_21950 [Paenibacillus abyssi]
MDDSRARRSYLLRLYIAKCMTNLGGTTEDSTFRPSTQSAVLGMKGFFVADYDPKPYKGLGEEEDDERTQCNA